MATVLLLTIFLPLIGAAGIWPLRSFGGRNAVRWWSLITTLATFALASVVVYGYFQPWQGDSPYYAWTNWGWLGEASGLDIRFAFSLDGISLWLFALSSLLMVTSVLVSWTAIRENAALFYAMLLLLETGCLGVFSAHDILLFYVFFEFTLIPLFFLIGVWGSEQRRYAAAKFFIYTLAGSVLTFLGLLTVVFWASGYVGTAGAFHRGAGVRPEGEQPLPLVFEIPEIVSRLDNQYENMLRVADANDDGAISFAEATDQRDYKIPRAARTFKSIAFDKLDADGNGRLSRAELIDGQTAAELEDTDILYSAAFFRAHDANDDGELTAAELTGGPETTRDQQLKTLKALGFDTEPLSADDGQLADWSLEPDELGVVDTDKLAAVTGWQLPRRSFAGIPVASLREYSSWTLPVGDIKANDFWLQMWIFLALFIGFAIKVPLFPLHTWLPLAHVQAPTAGSVFLAGILLKIGTYGFLRFNIPMLPEATAAAMPWLLWLSVAGIIYGALVALAQKDIKKLIAYSSVSHLGFCMLGLFALNALGTQGALLQMVNHGISTGALFAIVGMLYERYHTRQIKELGGISRTAPWMAFFMVLFTMSSIGLPGLNGFAGEFLILIGMFQRGWHDAPPLWAMQYKVISVVAVAGVVLGAWYMLWLVQRVFFGPLKTPQAAHPGGNREEGGESPTGDLTFREIAALAPLAVLALWIGLWPESFLKPMEQPLEAHTAAARELIDSTIQQPSAIAERRNGTRGSSQDAASFTISTTPDSADAEAENDS